MAHQVVDLRKTLTLAALSEAERALLAGLQGHVLKGHGRPLAAHLLLRFADAGAGRDWLRRLGPRLMRADAQLADADRVRQARDAAEPAPATPASIVCALSHAGYRALQVPAARRPADPAFVEGLKDRQPMLRDADAAGWEVPWQGEVHALLQVAGEAAQVALLQAELGAALPDGVTLLGVERGRRWDNAAGHAIEHFGFVSGRSQPLMIEEDLAREARRGGSGAHWSPRFPLAQVLVPDPAVDDPAAHGTYLVFRKLEQNVQAFQQAEARLARGLKKLGQAADASLAGALLVGRFADGTPLALHAHAGVDGLVPNDFDYAGDPQGLKCPLHAHIRKTNPRGDTGREFGLPPQAERARLMVRRGMTYGERQVDAQGRFSDAPAHGVGLLFMACQASIVEQFEFAQANWANDEGFVVGHTGIDPLAGQGGAVKHRLRAGWGDARAPTLQQRMAGFVTLKGGEYFFVPSLAFFATL